MPEAALVEPETVLLQVRMPKDLRDAFMRAAKAADDNASRLVRLWIREYVTRQRQQELFEE